MAQTVTGAQRALFVRTDRLGETLLNLPAMAALKSALPRASLTAMVNPHMESIISCLSWLEDVMTYREIPGRPWWLQAIQLGSILRNERFDIAIVSNPKKELHAAIWLAGIPYRVGYDRKWGWALTHRIQDRKCLGERHEVDYNLDLVRALGLPAKAESWHFPPLAREQEEIIQLLERQGVESFDPLIVVHPWTSNPLKCWPLERFRQLIRLIVERLRAQVVVIGGREERKAACGLVDSSLPAINLVGQLSLRQLIALLQRAKLLVSNDSGPVHAAAAVETPVVALFGGSDAATGPMRWGPWGEGHEVICKPIIESISVDEVFKVLERRWR